MKGRDLKYSERLEMADYLCHNNQLLVEDQIILFQIRTEINPLPANRGNHNSSKF